MVSRLIDELVDLKELFLPCRLEYNDPDQIKSQILRKAFTKPTPVNIKYKFYYRVDCLLDSMNPAVGINSAGPLMVKAVDSPPSRRSDESPAHSVYSTTDYDPDESMDELYHDSE